MPYKDYNDPRNLAYRKAYYERTKTDRYQRTKHNIYKWREKHPEQYKSLVNEYYADNKDQILKTSKNWREKNKEKISAYWKKEIDSLSDRYIKAQLIKDGYTRKDIRKNPELIEIKRILIKTKRLCKTSNN